MTKKIYFLLKIENDRNVFWKNAEETKRKNNELIE